MQYMQYIAIETPRDATSPHHELARRFCEYAKESSLGFTSLEYIGPVTVGSVSFERFRTDLTNVWRVLDRFTHDNTSVVGPDTKGYLMIRPQNSKRATIPSGKVCSVPTRHPITYRGTSVPYWERQFQS